MNFIQSIVMRLAPIFVALFALSLRAYIPDPHSQSNFEQVQVSHAYLNLDVDFEQKILSGAVELTLNNTSNSLILSVDTKELMIKNVEMLENDQWLDTTFFVHEAHEFLGSRLDIAISPASTKVRINYQTSPQAGGLQWLNQEQTGGKKMPFLYSQSEPIDARTFLPIQDSPQLRFTYEADLRVPVGMMAVMSAENPFELSPSGNYHFSMKQAIPAYLVALAVGDLAFKATGHRSGVYAEPYLLDDAAWEYADTEKMIAAGEKLFGPYLWERFDIVVMPPSFPIGGMENPRATFISSTTIAHDRSLVNVVAHEYVHSFFGNLVTNALWSDLWLNEGFTVLGERWILDEIYKKDDPNYRLIHEKLGELHLREELKDLAEPFTHLKLDLTGLHPDEAFSLVPYEKGYSFLRSIENLIGQERFGLFLQKYIQEHQFQSMTSEKLLDYLNKELSLAEQQELGFAAWVYGPGLPSSYQEIDCKELDDIEAQAKAQDPTNFPETMALWTTQKWQYYIKALPAEADLLMALEQKFTLSQKNAEIRTDWFLKLLDAQLSGFDLNIENFLLSVGRGKFIRPLYQKLKEKGRVDFARKIFEKAKASYHLSVMRSLEKMLNP